MRARNDILGFTLIELMIVLALVVLLLVMAAPSIQIYLENTKVRNVAESIEAGMLKARFHAMKNNVPTEIVITNGTTIGNWTISELNDTGTPVVRVAPPVETFTWRGGEHDWQRITVAPNTAGATTVTFDKGSGRVLRDNLMTTVAPPNNFTVSSSLTGTRQLRVDVLMTGGIRVCDLGLPATDPKSCRFTPI